MQQVPIDDLLNDGLTHMTVPHSNIPEAIERWTLALQIAGEEQDMIRQAKAYSNIGCAYRRLGKLVEAKQNLDKAWNLTTSYIRAAAAKQGSNWLQLAIRATGLDGDKIENAFVTHSKEEDAGLSKKSSVASSKSTTQTEFSQGPPIVVWILQLMTNMGNLCYSRGKLEAAIKCHSIVKRLVESIFEEYPPPPEILQCSLDANAMGKMNKNTEGTKKLYQLSYVHRHAIIAQALSLTHLGSCFGALGVSTTSLQYHKAGYNLLRDVAEYVPGFVPNSMLSPRTSSANTHSAIESNFNTNVVRYRACIAGNIGIGWQMLGDFAKSVQWHQSSLKLFEYHAKICRKKAFGSDDETRTVGLEEVRQNTQLAAMYTQLGSSLMTVHWLHKMEISHNADFFNTALAFRYWKSPLKKDQIPTFDLSKWLSVEHVLDKALGILYEQAYRQRILHDWTGLFVTWLNIGTS
jgi:tetratricopeptide (TPR) repeat protein